MAITANMTTHDGTALTDAYVRIPTAYVKKMDGNWKLVYDVLIYKDKDTRDDPVSYTHLTLPTIYSV